MNVGDIELTSAELDELERLAKAATPGPWHVPLDYRGEPAALWPYAPDGWAIGTDRDHAKQDAYFMAGCNPATILRLISLARSGLEARKAEESMRERAAAVAEEYEGRGMDSRGHSDHLGDAYRTRSDIATTIRALPLTEGGDTP